MNETIDVLLRAIDTDVTYLTWRWSDMPRHPDFTVLTPAVMNAVSEKLTAAFPVSVEQMRGTNWAFATVEGELELARTLTEAILPESLRTEIRHRVETGDRVRMRITLSPRLRAIPWELLCVYDGVRLIELAEVVLEPPPAVHAERSRLPVPWQQAREHPPCFVIDPKVPRRSAERFGLGNLLTIADLRPFAVRLEQYVAAGRLTLEEAAAGLRPRMNRLRLSRALSTPRSRLFYFGHISSLKLEPGSAALHLSDTAMIWGMAQALHEIDKDGTLRESEQDHRPFTALDLLLGTTLAPPTAWKAYGSDSPRPGHELWPMPTRVAIIGPHEGTTDYRSAETSGLAVAMAIAGAELVTTLRWIPHTDAAFRAAGYDITPTTEMALRVDSAHETDDPIDELAQWQRNQLDQWRETGRMTYNPLVWASLTHTIAPARRTADREPEFGSVS